MPKTQAFFTKLITAVICLSFLVALLLLIAAVCGFLVGLVVRSWSWVM